MKITKIPNLGRFGIYIDDVDLNTVTHEEWMEIGKLHMENLVTIIRGQQDLSVERQVELCTQFGDVRGGMQYITQKKYPGVRWHDLIQWATTGDPRIAELDRQRILNVLNVVMMFKDGEFSEAGSRVIRVSGLKDETGRPLGMFQEGELLWHSNESGTLTFTPGVALYAKENVVGSATGFITTPDYYESVSNAFRSELDEMIIVHRFTPGKINPGLREEQDDLMHANMCPVDDVEIPLVITSPGGIRGLHHTINTAYQIKGLSTEHSKEIFDLINRELFVDKYIYDHWYQNTGDYCFFDNSITLHRRLGDVKNRMCHRIQHDYTHLQSGFWQPYDQPAIADKFIEEMRDFVETVGVQNFKLPA